MKVCTWNVNKATKMPNREGVWKYLLEVDADIVFLQEVNSIPSYIADQYTILKRKAITKNDTLQNFSTAILVKGSIKEEIELKSEYKWVNEELKRFNGNLISAKVVLDTGYEVNVLSVYSPAWFIDKSRWEDENYVNVKLENNPELWVTELLYASLLNENIENNSWIIGGDLNSSLTFDNYSSKLFQGNFEIQNRMKALGFIECLNTFNNDIVPTFKNPKGGKVIHQIDHLFVTKNIYNNIINCKTSKQEEIFNESLSDHLSIIAEFDL